jgi:hypothetical protein
VAHDFYQVALCIGIQPVGVAIKMIKALIATMSTAHLKVIGSEVQEQILVYKTDPGCSNGHWKSTTGSGSPMTLGPYTWPSRTNKGSDLHDGCHTAWDALMQDV